MLLSDVCLTSVCLTSVAYIGPNSRTERLRKTKIGTEVAYTSHETRTPVSKSKVGQLVADVLNSQHAGRRYLANKYEYIVNLQGAEAYCAVSGAACWGCHCVSVHAFEPEDVILSTNKN